MEALATHHFVTKSKTAEFIVEADNLKPYSVLEGNWFVNILFIKGNVGNAGGFVITSKNAVSANERKIILASFSAEQHTKGQNITIFHGGVTSLTGHRITYAADRLQFELRTFEDATVEPTGDLCLGVALVQYYV